MDNALHVYLHLMTSEVYHQKCKPNIILSKIWYAFMNVFLYWYKHILKYKLTLKYTV